MRARRSAQANDMLSHARAGAPSLAGLLAAALALADAEAPADHFQEARKRSICAHCVNMRTNGCWLGCWDRGLANAGLLAVLQAFFSSASPP